jgi:CRP-like cAMP-binding protein
MNGAPLAVLQRVPLFADLSPQELQEIALEFRESDFEAGSTILREGSGGAAFYVIEAGEATVSINGTPHSTLTAGDYFGEIALLDEGPRMATITAATRLDCWCLTASDFRTLVEANGVIAWKLLQRMAMILREERGFRQG